MKKLYLTLLMIGFSLTFSTNKSMAQCDATYADDNVLLASIGKKLYRSTDGGNTFTHVIMAGEDDVEVRTISKVGNTIIAGGINGDIRVFKSTDNGATWTTANNGMPTINGFVSSVPVCSITIGSRIFMGGTNFAEYSDDEGATWNDIPTVPTMTNALKYTGGKLWHSSYSQMRYSSDNGMTWTQSASPLFGGASAVGYNQMGSKLIMLNHFSGAQAVKQSLDNGASWATIGNLSIGLDMIEIDGDLYAACYDGLMKSSDEGQTWINACSDFQYYAYGGKLSYHNGIIWAASNNGLVKYTIATNDCELIEIDASVGIDEAVDNQIEIYPNPANYHFMLSNVPQNCTVTIFNSMGQLISQIKSNGNELAVSISNLPAGIYQVSIQHQNQVTNKKLIVNPNN